MRLFVMLVVNVALAHILGEWYAFANMNGVYVSVYAIERKGN